MADKLKGCHRKLSSSPMHSDERRTALSRPTHAYRHLTDRRRVVCCNIANDIVDSCDIIFMEDLSVKALRSISRDENMTNMYNDALLGELRRRISYKAIGAGKRIILVEPKGTSQTCSECGSQVRKDLSIREHVCPNCGLVMDRDLNASINILYRGMGKLGWTGHPVPPMTMGTNSPVIPTGAQRMGV
ncbi:MAG: transposase [Candidatus Methanomethylophilaceae archaeon]|nr:transposase [Candidatus Methanomethylophilaceae archaeon]